MSNPIVKIKNYLFRNSSGKYSVRKIDTFPVDNPQVVNFKIKKSNLKKEKTELGNMFRSTRSTNLNLLRVNKKRENLIISDPFDFKHIMHIGLDKNSNGLKNGYYDLTEIKRNRNQESKRVKFCLDVIE